MASQHPATYTVLTFRRQELTPLNNALNEVCNGICFTDDEFHPRLGGCREEAREVLWPVAEVLHGERDQPRDPADPEPKSANQQRGCSA